MFDKRRKYSMESSRSQASSRNNTLLWWKGIKYSMYSAKVIWNLFLNRLDSNPTKKESDLTLWYLFLNLSSLVWKYYHV